MDNTRRRLGDALRYTPVPLAFGTSGRRGRVADLSQLEVYATARAELEYLLSRPRIAGGIQRGDTFYYGHDLRPSSTRFVATQGGRGELAQVIARAATDVGLKPVNLGALPTPALTAFALARGSASMMVTGSHIPFDRNGYKTNSAVGELLKSDEAPIAAHVARVRAGLLETALADSPFDEDGFLKSGSRPCPPADAAGARAYIARYVEALGTDALRGVRVLVYQHSAAGRDLLVEMLQALGAEARPFGRSDTFVPIDTEAIDDTILTDILTQAVEAAAGDAGFHAIVSTDGDSDRPLIIGLEHDGAAYRGEFFRGDAVGMVVAQALGPDAVVVPITCNDGIDRGPLAPVLRPKTRIGSPYVIAGMLEAQASGAQRTCGWEANGGFLTGSAFDLGHGVLPALPTRDAFLPIACVLRQKARTRDAGLSAQFAALPARYTQAGLLRECPREVSQAIIAALTPSAPAHHEGVSRSDDAYQRIESLVARPLSCGAIARVNATDGVRVTFANGDVVHLRPSGNADELRVYAVADTQARADALVAMALRSGDGVLADLVRQVGVAR